MASTVRKIFPQRETDRILRAVQEAERGTSGEIVPYVVQRSDRYDETIWRGAAIAGAVVALLFGLLPLIGDTWMTLGVTPIATIVVGAALLAGLVLLLVPSVRIMLTDRRTIRHRVAQRAAEAFLAEEVFNTRDRVGILIFLSLDEHRVVILGDSGINARIAGSEWDAVVEIVVGGILAGRHADGLIEGVRRCGMLLAERGFAIADGDRNELPDRLRTEPPRRDGRT